MASLAVDLRGDYAYYDQLDSWVPKYQRQVEQRRLTPWILGQMIFGSHREGRFRTEIRQKSIVAGSALPLKIEGITPFAPLAIVGGRLDNRPAEAHGKIIMPFEESLDALVRIPEDAKSGIYVFFGQQWEPGGKPAYPGGSLIYPSAMASVEVRPHIDEEAFWNSFESWSEEDAEEVRENIRRYRERLRGAN